jgi:hypothetical protein
MTKQEYQPTLSEIASQNSIDKRSNRIKIGIVAAISIILGGYWTYDNFVVPDKQLTAKGFTPESIKLIQKISRQNHGLELIDPIKQTVDKNTIADFNSMSNQFYQAQDECKTTIEIKSDDTYVDIASIGRIITQEIPPEIRKVGKVNFDNLKLFKTNIQQLRVSCLQTVAFTPSKFNLNSIVLSGELSNTLIAEPNNPIRTGIDPAGFYLNITNQVFIRGFHDTPLIQDLFPHENQHRMADVSLPRDKGNFEIQKTILGEKLFNEWKNNGFEVSNNLVNELEKMGLNEYTLHIDSSDWLSYYRKTLKDVKVEEKKIKNLQAKLFKDGDNLKLINLKNEIVKIEKNLSSLKTKLIRIETQIQGPHEVDSTAMGSHWPNNISKVEVKKAEDMQVRFSSLMHKYNSDISIFDSKERIEWLRLVNITKTLCEFYKQNKK